ncbi:MAG: hypothetical protein RI897_3025 [Verrucomicrobiota bacterium]
MGCAEAEVGSEAEGEVGVGFAVEADFVGCVEDGFVEVSGGPAERDAFIGGHLDALDFRVFGADAADMGEGHEHAEEFFAGVDDAFGVFAEEVEAIRVSGEVGEDGGDGMDDGIAAAGEREVAEAEHFVAGEVAALVGGLGEGTEEIVPRVLGGFVEFAVEVVFQDRAFFERAVCDLEDVDAPADPDVCL